MRGRICYLKVKNAEGGHNEETVTAGPMFAVRFSGGSGSIMPEVVVLLSVSNGARHLDDQIQSILAQTWPRVRLIVRDDGSIDQTWAVLAKWRRESVIAFRGRSTGAQASFLQMLGMVDRTTELVSFADHGDVWHPRKVERAAERLLTENGATPALYFSRGILTDGGRTPDWRRPPSFGNALVENITVGSTIVLNRAAIARVKSAGAPREVLMHDWWCYLIVAAFGRVIYDPEPLVLLREQDSKPPWRRVRPALDRIIEQAWEFRRHFGSARDLQPADRRLLDIITQGSALERRMLAVNPRLHRQLWADDLRMRLRLLAGPWPGGSAAQGPTLQKIGFAGETSGRLRPAKWNHRG